MWPLFPQEVLQTTKAFGGNWQAYFLKKIFFPINWFKVSLTHKSVDKNKFINTQVDTKDNWRLIFIVKTKLINTQVGTKYNCCLVLIDAQNTALSNLY